ncbi:MAG: hypothetical protein WAU69_11355 [Solirubrobacteraceae bacterium]
MSPEVGRRSGLVECLQRRPGLVLDEDPIPRPLLGRALLVLAGLEHLGALGGTRLQVVNEIRDLIVRRRKLPGKKKWSRGVVCAITSLTAVRASPAEFAAIIGGH